MAIEKGLYGMPEGIDEALAQNMGEPDAVIEMDIVTKVVNGLKKVYQ